MLWDDLGCNLCVDDQKGDPAAVSEAFARAAHVVRMDLVNNRVSGVPMEPRSAVGVRSNDGSLHSLGRWPRGEPFPEGNLNSLRLSGGPGPRDRSRRRWWLWDLGTPAIRSLRS